MLIYLLYLLEVNFMLFFWVMSMEVNSFLSRYLWGGKKYLKDSSQRRRSSHHRCFTKKSIFEKFAIFTGKQKTPVLESLFNKIAGLKACSFIKKRLQYKCFPVNTAKFFRILTLKNICERLLLDECLGTTHSF